MKERNTTLETTDHNNRDNSENIKETPDERIPGKLIGAIVAVGSLAFIGILTETVMTVLFPQLMREFNVNTATVQWITTIYLLTVAATMPLSSYLNRKFKHRVLFLAAVALAVLGSLTMIFGHAFPVILVARIIQGIGSGVATPLMMNIILEQSPRSKVGRLMGVGSLVITVAPAIGPTVGGAVSSILPWRAIFVIVIPVILLISLPVGLKCIEQHRPTEEAHLNPLQFAAIVLALCGLVMFLNQAGVAVAAAVSGGNDERRRWCRCPRRRGAARAVSPRAAGAGLLCERVRTPRCGGGVWRHVVRVSVFHDCSCSCCHTVCWRRRPPSWQRLPARCEVPPRRTLAARCSPAWSTPRGPWAPARLVAETTPRRAAAAVPGAPREQPRPARTSPLS